MGSTSERDRNLVEERCMESAWGSS